MKYDQTLLLDAVNALVQEEDPCHQANALDATGALRRRYTVVFDGDLAILNPLLVMYDNPDMLASLQKLIDTKRTALGRKPCWPEVEEKFDKNNYQRELMAKRRERAHRALAIANAQRPAKDVLKGVHRLEFLDKTLARWGAAVQVEIDALRLANGGSLTKSQDQAARLRLWAKIDAELDQREEALRRELLKPVAQRKNI